MQTNPEITAPTERGEPGPGDPVLLAGADKAVRVPGRAARQGKNLLVCVGVIALILAAYNLLIHQISKTSQRQQLLAYLHQMPADTDILFLGNSLVEAGCDAKSFKAGFPNTQDSPRPANVALGGTSPVEHYLILKHALERNLHIKYVVYGFFDDQLNEAVEGDWAKLVGNRALSYYFPNEAAELYAPGSVLKKWQLNLISKVPMLSERSSLWTKVELLRRRFSDIGMPAHDNNRFGRAADFAALEATDVPSFNRRCAAAANRGGAFSAPIEKMVRLAQQNRAKVILVEMPMPSRHRDLFYSSPAWLDLRGRLQARAAQEQAVYLKASDWIADDQKFMDVTHLSEAGAKEFSEKLASAIANLQTKAAASESQRAPIPSG